MRLDHHLLAAECARTGPQHQMKRVFRINRQSTDLRAVHSRWSGDVARFLAIAEEGEGNHICGRDFDGIPFEDYGCLRSVSAAELGGNGLCFAEGGVDCVLEREEGILGFGLGFEVTCDGDVYYAAGGDIGREEDRGEFNLRNISTLSS